MTVRTNAIQTCDRCLKPFNEKHLKSGDAVPTFKQRGLVVTETTGTTTGDEPKFTVLFSFDDMCPDCQKAVDNLLAKVRLDAKPAAAKKGPAKKRGSRKKKEEEPKPPAEEYAEGSAAEGAEPAPPDPDAPPPKEETEPLAEAKSEEPASGPQEDEGEPEPPAEEPEESSGGNGAEAASDDDTSNLIEDPSTGDRYDPETGEVVVRGSKNGGKEKHPF